MEGYAVHVRFEDSTSADVDLSYLLDYGGVFDPLRDPEYFRQLRADPDAGTIVWPNGRADHVQGVRLSSVESGTNFVTRFSAPSGQFVERRSFAIRSLSQSFLCALPGIGDRIE